MNRVRLAVGAALIVTAAAGTVSAVAATSGGAPFAVSTRCTGPGQAEVLYKVPDHGLVKVTITEDGAFVSGETFNADRQVPPGETVLYHSLAGFPANGHDVLITENSTTSTAVLPDSC